MICFPITLNWDDHTNFLKIQKLKNKTKNLSSHLENNKNSKTPTLQCLKRETKCMLVSRTMKVHLEKEMATHSTVLAWRIPGTGKPGGLPSMGSHRVRHDWSNLAAAAAAWRYIPKKVLVVEIVKYNLNEIHSLQNKKFWKTHQVTHRKYTQQKRIRKIPKQILNNKNSK